MIEKVNPSHPDKVADRIAGAITKREALLQDLVDKAAPKKAKEVKVLMELRYYCPTCESFLGINEMVNNYCAICGQHLDWSEEE